MTPHLLYYQLVILVLLWLCVMLPYLWPSPGSHPKRAEPTPIKAKRKRSNESKPFAGLTQKPHCELCEQASHQTPPPPPVRPDPMLPTNRRPRTIDTSSLTIPLLYFFRLRVAAEGQARIEAQACVKGFRLVPLTQEIIAHALASVLLDFEDNIPRGSAATIAAHHVITRNQRHFQPTQVSVVNPEEWLARETGSRIETGLPTASC